MTEDNRRREFYLEFAEPLRELVRAARQIPGLDGLDLTIVAATAERDRCGIAVDYGPLKLDPTAQALFDERAPDDAAQHLTEARMMAALVYSLAALLVRKGPLALALCVQQIAERVQQLDQKYSADDGNVVAETSTYRIGLNPAGHVYIRCKKCGLRSFNPKDVSERYCGRCSRFHDDPPSAERCDG